MQISVGELQVSCRGLAVLTGLEFKFDSLTFVER